jgi:hypothetical protein
MTVLPVPSPCVNVCRMDEPTGWCAGCLRTLDEIANWSRLGEVEKLAIQSELGRRRVQWLRLRHAGRAGEPA